MQLLIQPHVVSGYSPTTAVKQSGPVGTTVSFLFQITYTLWTCAIFIKHITSLQYNELQFLSQPWSCSYESEVPFCSQLWSLHFCSTDLSLKVMLLFWPKIWPLAFPATTRPTSPPEVWFYWLFLCVHQCMTASYRLKVKEACLLCTATIQTAIKRVWYAGLGSLLLSASVCAQLRRAEGTVFGLR